MDIEEQHNTVSNTPILSRDLQVERRDLQMGCAGPLDEMATVQPLLPGIVPVAARKPRRRPQSRKSGPPAAPPDDPLMASFLRRLAAQGVASEGLSAYRRQLRSTMRIASRLAGVAVTAADLFQNEPLLGRSVVDDEAREGGGRLSKWTLAQRRSAIRKFVTLMRPELVQLLGEDPNIVLDRALRAVAERVGGGYRLTGGSPRRRGGRAPSEGQIGDVLAAVGRAPGYHGSRNLAFFRILAETGTRVNALRQLHGADCVEMPSGRLRLFLHEKGKGEPREVELSHASAEALRTYVEAFNHLAAVRRWRVRVRLGEPGPIWRNSARGCWSYGDVLATLRAGCSAAEVPEFTPHALRRAFATDAATVLPRHTVAQAGGWQGVRRLDDHYIQPRGATIREKLRRSELGSVTCGSDGDEEHVPVPTL